ncbi:MAG: hypothetical protein AAFP69_23795, partial [Planctomycetota bacterium]
TPLTDPKNVLAQSLISGLRDANFIHSALPIFDKRTDQALCESLASEIQTADSGIRVGALTPTLQKRLEQNPVDLRHLRNLEEIDRYCRSNATFTVRRNSVGLNVKLGHCLDAMLKFGNAPKNLAFVSDFYADVVNANDIDKLNRSIVYDAAEKKFGFTDRRAIVIEMADSLYMWNQGRLAGAHSETTSSGVDSDDPNVVRQGETVSFWADQVKSTFHKDDPDWETRPVLQKGSINSEDRLADPKYREQLLLGLAAFIVNEDFHPLTVGDVQLIQSARSHVDINHRAIERWHALSQRVNGDAILSGLVRLDITEHGAFHLTFKEAQHHMVALTPGTKPSGETQDQLEETLRNQAGEPSESKTKSYFGADVPILGIPS